MADLISQFGSFGWALVAFIVALSIIVAIHEYGHYIVGRWCGIHTEVFSLGMGPVLFSRVDKRGTKWQVAALPFGGYCKFLGDANAASVGDSGDVAAVDRRRTMLGAPLWARSLTVLAGPVFNFVLSAFIFTAVIMSQGEAADPVRVADLQGLPDSYAQQLQPGDELLSINGVPVPGIEGLSAMLDGLPEQQVLDYLVLRDGSERAVTGPFPSPPAVQGLTPGSASYDAGFLVGDVITAIDGAPIFAFDHLITAVNDAEGGELVMDVWRGGETLQITLSPRRQDIPNRDGGFETRWLIGISGGLFFGLATETPSLGDAASLGVAQVGNIMTTSLSGLYHMVTGAISSCNLSGPVGIAQASGAMASQGGTSFIWFVAVISTAVGLLNLFPVPILDGGHLVFHAYEAVTRRPPSEGALRVLMAGGLAIILTLMIFAVANDLFLCP